MSFSSAPFLYGSYGLEDLPKEQRVFGVPGGSLASATEQLGEAQIKAGTIGEKRTGEILQRIADGQDNFFVFHAYKLPGHVGDIDHIVVYGKTVATIDSKNWKGGMTYEFSDELDGSIRVTRDGQEFAGGVVHAHEHSQRVHAELDEEVRRNTLPRSILVITNSVTIVNHSRTLLVVQLSDLESTLNTFIQKEGVVIQFDAARSLRQITSRVVNPDFDGDWVAIAGSENRNLKSAYVNIGQRQIDNRGPLWKRVLVRLGALALVPVIVLVIDVFFNKVVFGMTPLADSTATFLVLGVSLVLTLVASFIRSKARQYGNGAGRIVKGVSILLLIGSVITSAISLFT